MEKKAVRLLECRFLDFPSEERTHRTDRPCDLNDTNPFPAAHEDAMTAWRFLRRQGIAADHIAVGGDSAGGNLSLALIERPARGRRAAARLRPDGLALDRPDDVRRDACEQGCGRSLIHKAYLDELAAAYVPDNVDRKNPLISPLFADLSGFPLS
jgi:acetyl esterase/lipase